MTQKLWDFTALDVLEKCEEEFVRRFLYNLESPSPKVEAIFGQALHVGTRLLYDGTTVSEAVARAALYFAEECKEPSQKKPYLTPEFVAAIVEMYAKVYEGKLSCVLNEHYLANEELGLDGILDRLVERNGVLAVRDLKSTGLYVGEAWGNQWQQSAQAAGYLDLAEAELNGGVLRSVLRAPRQEDASGAAAAPAPLPYRDVSTFWCDAIHVDKRGYPKEGDFHEFGPFSYSPALRGELREQRGRAILRANELVEHPERAVKRTHNCMRYNALCGFFSYCWSDPEEREERYEMARASGALTTRTWRPEARDNNE